MSTRKSTLSHDEKALLRHGRALGLPVSIALLRREIERQPRADKPGEQRRQMEPDAGVGYVTKS